MCTIFIKRRLIQWLLKIPALLKPFKTILKSWRFSLNTVWAASAHFETIGQGAGAHGIDVDALIEDINKVIAEAEANK